MMGLKIPMKLGPAGSVNYTNSHFLGNLSFEITFLNLTLLFFVIEYRIQCVNQLNNTLDKNGLK